MAGSRYIVLEAHGAAGPATHAPELRLRRQNPVKLLFQQGFKVAAFFQHQNSEEWQPEVPDRPI